MKNKIRTDGAQRIMGVKKHGGVPIGNYTEEGKLQNGETEAEEQERS